MRRESTGEIVGPWVAHFAHPFRWVYSVLRATDYMRRASIHDGVVPDPRLAEAIEVVRDHRRGDGTWVQEIRHTGQAWFEVDVPPGAASPWLTMYGARVLQWWDASAGKR